MESFLDYQQLYSSSLSANTQQFYERDYGSSDFSKKPEMPEHEESLKKQSDQQKQFSPTPPTPKKNESLSRARLSFLPPVPPQVTMYDIYKANGRRALTYFEREDTSLNFDTSLLWAIRENPSWLIRLGESMDSRNPESGFKKLMSALKKAKDPNIVLRVFVDK